MSKGPKKKPARSKAKAKVKISAKVQAETQAEGPDQTRAPTAKKTGGGNAAVSLIVFLSVLGAGAYINWMFWSETVSEKAGPAKTGTEADGTTPPPEPASKEIAPTDVQKDAPKESTKEPLGDSPGDSPGDSAEKMAAELRQLRQALDRLMTRMESIEKSLDRVKKIAQATTPPAEKLRSSTVQEGSPRRLDSVAESDGKIKALMQRMDKMEKDYAAPASAPAPAPALDLMAPAEDTGGNPDVGALILAVGNLRQALTTDGPFDKALHALKALAGDSPEISAAVALLVKNAPKGLATTAVLAERFGALAGKIVQAFRQVEEKDWLDRAVNRMSRLVSWRRVDGKGEKSSVDALVAAAEAHLKAGDLKAAIKAIEGLSVNAPANAKAAAVAASWLADAKARLAADRAIAGLHLHALSLLAPAPLTPAPLTPAPLTPPSPEKG